MVVVVIYAENALDPYSRFWTIWKNGAVVAEIVASSGYTWTISLEDGTYEFGISCYVGTYSGTIDGMPFSGVDIDHTVAFTVGVPSPPPGEAEASIIGIRVLGNGVWYSVYPELQPAHCSADGLVVSYGALNVGTEAGYLYGRILGPGGVLLHEGVPRWVNVGNFGFWEPTLTMPGYDLSLEVEVSASPSYAVSDKVSFKLASTEVSLEAVPISLPLIAAGGLAVVDAALVAAYLLKHFKVID